MCEIWQIEAKSQIRWERSAFTLIELLVVVSIIALLIALLLPALESARVASRQVGCQSNLRSVGMATQLYSDEWDGSLPYYETWYCEPGPCVGDGPDEVALINHYLGPDQFNTAGNVVCPSFEEDPPTTTRHATGAHHSSYGYNARYLGVTAFWTGNSASWILRKRDEFNHPSDVISDADTGFSNFYGLPSGNAYWPIIHRSFDVASPFGPAETILSSPGLRWPVGNRHHDGANVVSLDGHVEWQLQTYWHEWAQQKRWEGEG